MSFEENSFVVLTGNEIIELQTASNINIRYANVMYPLPTGTDDDVYNQLAEEVRQQMQQIDRLCSNSIQLIIQAPADSLSVQPSREGLTETEYTLNALCHILNNWLGVFATDFKNARDKEQRSMVANYNKMPMDKRGNVYGHLIGSIDRVKLSQPKYVDAKQIGKELAVATTVSNETHRYMAMTTLKRWKEAKLMHPKLYLLAKHAYKRGNTCRTERMWSGARNDYRHQYRMAENSRVSYIRDSLIRWYRPLFKRLAMAGFDASRLFYSFNDAKHEFSEHWVHAKSPFDLAQFNERYVVITSNKSTIMGRLTYVMTGINNNSTNGLAIYHVKQGDRKNGAAIEAAIKKAGFKVINMLNRHPSEPVPTSTAAGVRSTGNAGIRIKAADSVVKLGACIVNDRTDINLLQAAKEDAERITDPILVFKVSFAERASYGRLPELTPAYSKLLALHFGDKIGLVNSSPMEEKWKNKGATASHIDLMIGKTEEIWKSIEKDVYKALSGNADRMLEHWGALKNDTIATYVPDGQYRSSYKIRNYLRACLGAQLINMPKTDQTALDRISEVEALREHIGNELYRFDPKSEERLKRLDACKVDYNKVVYPKAVLTFVKKLAASPFIGILDTDEMIKLIEDHGGSNEYVKLFMQQVRKTNVKD